MAEKQQEETEAERVTRLVTEELAKRGVSVGERQLCLTCGTDLVRDRNEYVCPAEGHRFQIQGGKLVVAARKMFGPGPDGVPDRRRYPSLDGGVGRRTSEPKDSRPRALDPMDEEAKRATREARQARACSVRTRA
jgi:hypothetical protein